MWKDNVLKLRLASSETMFKQSARKKNHIEWGREKWHPKSFEKHRLPADMDIDIAIVRRAAPVLRGGGGEGGEGGGEETAFALPVQKSAASSWNATGSDRHAIKCIATASDCMDWAK